MTSSWTQKCTRNTYRGRTAHVPFFVTVTGSPERVKSGLALYRGVFLSSPPCVRCFEPLLRCVSAAAAHPAVQERVVNQRSVSDFWRIAGETAASEARKMADGF